MNSKVNFIVIYEKDGDAIPIEDPVLLVFLGLGAPFFLRHKREDIEEGRDPDLWINIRFLHRKSGLPVEIKAYVGDPDMTEKGEQPIAVVLPHDSYQNFQKISQMQGWDQVIYEEDGIKNDGN